MQKKGAKFTSHIIAAVWETLAQRRRIARICAHFGAYIGESGMEIYWEQVTMTCYLSGDDHDRKIRARKQRADIGKYSYVSRTN